MRRRRCWTCVLVAVAVAAPFVACADAENGGPGASSVAVLPGPDSAPEAATSDAGLVDAACDGCSATAAWPFTAVTLPIDGRYNLLGAWGSAQNDVWAVGTAGTAVHFDGTSWAASTTPTVQALYAVWGRSADDVWAVSNAGVLLHRTTASLGTWKLEAPIDADNPWPALAVRGFGTAQLFVVGSGFVGNADQGIPFASIMGAGHALADGGTRWVEPSGCITCTDLHGLWGTGADDLWVVGENGAAQHSTALDDAGAPQWVGKQTFTERTLNAVWGSSTADVWAVGAMGTIRHWTNDPSQRWSEVASGTSADLLAVWGSGPSDIWAVGASATVVHYDGTAWSPRIAQIASPDEAASLNGVWGSGPGDVWIVGRGVVLHSTKVGPP